MKTKTPAQLELAIKEARSGADGQPQTSEQLIDHIIKLYGAEFIKANDELIKMRNIESANNELKRKLAQIANAWHTQHLTTARLNAILSGDEQEDLLWRYHNDGRFHNFVEHMCEETLELYRRRHS